MQAIVVANKKGGVGKTTTVQNVAAGLARTGKKVLALDMDAQANLTLAWGVAPSGRSSVLDVLRHLATWQECAVPVESGSDTGGCVFLVPASRQLAAMPEVFSQEFGKELLLKEALQELDEKAFDVVLIDSPPSLDLIAVNTYVAADLVLIPVQCEFYALEGLELMQQDMARVRQRLNPELTTLGILPTFFDKRKRLCRDVLAMLRQKYPEETTQTVIRDTVALAEAPSNARSIFAYDPQSYGTGDYTALCRELKERMEAQHGA